MNRIGGTRGESVFPQFIKQCKQSEHIESQGQLVDRKKQQELYRNFDLRESLMKAFAKNQKDYINAETKKLPKGLEQFIESDLCFDFLESILEYCQFLIMLEDKKKNLEQDARRRNIPAPQVLRSEVETLNARAKRMSDNYGKLIFTYRSVGLPEDYNGCSSVLQFRTRISMNEANDKSFYESVMSLIQKTLLPAFDRHDMQRVEEEISRLFRSNAFNISERLHARERMVRKFPAMKDYTGGKNDLETIKMRMEMRQKVPKEPFKPKPLYSPKGEIRPLFVNLTPQSSGNGRSPLVSLMFPTVKDKITILSKAVESQKTSRDNSPNFLDNIELERIVKLETRNRNKSHGYYTMRT